MICHDQVVYRWMEHLFGRTETELKRTDYLIPRGDLIFSYGSHFEIARLLRDRHGNPEQFLINGDVWGSSSTARHQSTVRGYIERSGLPWVIIPHQALNAAGIDRNDVRIVEVTPDTWEEKEHVYVDEVPPGCTVYWDKLEDYVELTPEELQAKADAFSLERYEEWAKHQRWGQQERDGAKPDRYWTKHHWLEKCPTALTVQQWYTQLNEWSKREETRAYRVIGHQLRCGRKNSWRLSYDITYLPNGSTQYRRTSRRHWLGESLVEAKIAYPLRRTCKWCKGSGRAEGPVLANWIPPEPILKTVRFDERPYYRYVDTLQVKPGYFEEYPRPPCSACRGQGRWRETRHRTAKYLSGFDRNESRRSYFLCELQPGSAATTVAEAYESLKPEAVKIAEEQGRKVARQGDIFAVRLSPATTKRSLRRMGARFERRGQLFGTNHVATEVAYLPDGNTVVRGVLHHVPRGRGPDHARVRLDEGWHLVQKNTVPIAA